MMHHIPHLSTLPPPPPPPQFIDYLKRTAKGLGLPDDEENAADDVSARFLVGTQELTKSVGIKARGIFVFDP